jgi:hypothetical protein
MGTQLRIQFGQIGKRRLEIHLSSLAKPTATT